ncbi:MAG: iron-containing alcohol dehydrogenase [Propionibacteriales bacterium]|nr:iron-containing alcohol dehydrogenase [Propionibacteriales bacterium]
MAEQGVAKYLVPEIVFGHGVLSEVGHAARRLGAVRFMLVTDPGIIEAGWAGEAQEHLRAVGLDPVVWADVTPNPKDHEVARGAEIYLERECDGLVVVGGGSSIDAAKGVAVVVSNGGRIVDYEGIDRVTRPIPPIVAAPSTSGTGADVSQFCVVTDTARHIKSTLIGRALVPDISVTDPRLLHTMPDWLAASTGLDALSHGIEAYVSRAASFLTDGHALSAIRLVMENLQVTLKEPEAVDARIGMARASLSAGLAFTNAILGATHAISHQLGGATDLPHGVLNAILMPHVMRFNAERDPERFVDVAQALGLSTRDMPATEAAEFAAEAVAELATSVGTPKRLSELGVKREDLPLYARTTLADANMSTNPRDASAEDILGVLRAAY